MIRVNTTSSVPRELHAEFIRERIYGAVTLMAVSAGLLFVYDDITVGHAFSVITSTALGLWAASLFAFFMSHRLVHDTPMNRKEAWRGIIAHRGILVSATAPILLLLVAATGLIEVQTALTAQIVLVIASMIFLSLRSTNPETRLRDSIISVLVQVLAAGTVISIKLISY